MNVLHIIRNPDGFTEEEVREARYAAADRIEALERELAAMGARAERMRAHILTKVVSRLCDVPSGKFHGEWGCGLCGGVGKGPASGVRELSTIAHEPDCMVAPLK